MKWECRIKLRRDDERALLVDIAPFAGQKIADANRGQAFGEGSCGTERHSDDKLALLVDVAPFVINARDSQPIGEWPHGIKLRLDDKLALLIDITPFAGQEFADANCSQALGEGEQVCNCKWRSDDEIALFVDVADFAADADAGQPFGECARLIKLWLDDDANGLIRRLPLCAADSAFDGRGFWIGRGFLRLVVAARQ